MCFFPKDKSPEEILKLSCEIIALISAAAFFIFKAFSGVLYSSLSLELSFDHRQAFQNDTDMLPVQLKLTGGENAVMDIHQVMGRVLVDGLPFGSNFYFTDIARLHIYPENDRLVIEKDWQMSATRYKYRVNIKESTSFGMIVLVPKGKTCLVEIAVAASRKNRLSRSQCRISKISVPELITGQPSI